LGGVDGGFEGGTSTLIGFSLATVGTLHAGFWLVGQLTFVAID
jgi:hypothetical protein